MEKVMTTQNGETAYLVGQVKSKRSLHECAALYDGTDLIIRISRYEIEVTYRSASSIATFCANEGEFLFHREEGLRLDVLKLASLLSGPLTVCSIPHRFEVYDEASDDLTSYHAFDWQQNCPAPGGAF